MAITRRARALKTDAIADCRELQPTLAAGTVLGVEYDPYKLAAPYRVMAYDVRRDYVPFRNERLVAGRKCVFVAAKAHVVLLMQDTHAERELAKAA